MKKRILALVLVLAMVLSMVPSAFANTSNDVEDGDKVINYVSLGESMTNGYGNPGYYPEYTLKEDGYQPAEYIDRMDVLKSDNAMYKIFPDSYCSAADGMSNTFGRDQKNVTTYASEFAKYLQNEVYKDATVNWQPWAISGQRPEDFYWLMQESWCKGMDAGEDEGIELFSNNVEGKLAYNGDMYTTAIWKNGNRNEAQVSRFIAAYYGRFSQVVNDLSTGMTDGKSPKWYHDSFWNDYWDASDEAEQTLAEVRDEYIKALKNADVISVNLGTHCFAANVSSQIHEVLADSPKQYLYEDAKRNDPQALLAVLPEEYRVIYDAIMEIIDQELASFAELGDAEWIEGKLAKIKNIYAYATLSFIATYDLSLERIREINPNAQIIVLGMSNFQEGLQFVKDDGTVVDFGGLFGLLVDFTNLYRAGWVEDSKNCIFVPAVDDMHLLIDEFADGKTNIIYLAKIVANLGIDYEVADAVCNTYLGEGGEFPESAATVLGTSYAKTVRQAWAIEYLYTGKFPEGANVYDKECLAHIKEVYDKLRAIADQETFDYEESLALVTTDKDVTMPDAMANILGGENVNEGYKMVAHFWIRCFMGEGVGCHPSETGHKQVAEKMIECYKAGFTGEDYVNSEVPGAFTVEEIYTYLKENKYIDNDQLEKIVDFVAEKALNSDMTDDDTKEIAGYIYETLLYNEKLTPADKVAIVYNVYCMIKGDFLGDYAKELALVEALCARPEMAKITAEQTWAIIDCVYNAVKAGNVNARAIAKEIYFDILTVKAASAAVAGNGASGSSSSGSETELTAGDKLDIIMAVYEVLVAEEMLDETTDLKAVKDLYVSLTDPAAPVVSDEVALSIFDTVFGVLVEDEDIDDEDIANVATQVVDQLLGEESELTPEAKAAVLEKVTAALKDTSFAGSVAGATIPALDVITDLRAALEEAGYLTDAEAGRIIEIAYKFIKNSDTLTELDKAELADEIYTILLNKDGMTVEQKVEVLTIVYTVLDEYNYVAGGIGYAFLVAYNAAKENGYIDAAIVALDVAKAAVELAKAEVEKFDLAEAEEVLADAKALVVEELNNIVDTMDKIQGVLAAEELTPALYQELLSFEQELEKHCVTAVALARELNEALSPYVFQEVEKVVNEALAAVDFIHEIAADAYEFVTGIPAAYDAWVEEVGAKVDAISPELGALVREYLKANAADAMAIIYAYGDVAVEVLISDAVAACGDITDASINFLRVIVDNAPVMHEVIKNNAEVQALLDQLTENLKKAKAVAEWTIDNPFVAAYIAAGIDQETALNAVYAELVRIHDMAYPAVMSALHAIDPLAAEDFSAAYEALITILCTTYDAAEGYLGWVAGHAQAMACELLCALLDNTWEFVCAASPVVDNLMYDWLYTHPYEVIEFCTENAAEIEALIEEYGIYVVGVLGYIAATYGPEVVDFIIENPCEALDMFMDWYNKYGYRIWPMIDVYLEALGVYDAIDHQLGVVNEQIMAMLSDLDAHILAQIAALNAALKDAHDEMREQILAEIEALNEMLMAFLKANISAYYVVGPNSYYVALGDAGAYGPAADKLAAELGMTDKYANLTFADATAGEVLAMLDAAEIAKADLITLGFSANTFTTAVVTDLMNAMFEEVDKDWASLVGEEGAAAIDAALVELTAYVTEQVGDEMIAALLTVAVESYAYTYITHLVDYVVVSEAIHEINADALLVLVGMHNPMDGVVVDLNGEQLDLGEYLNYLVTLTNIYSFAYALIAEDTIYVDAPDVETNYDGAVMSVEELINDLLYFNETVVKYEPTDAGYEYIKEQIYNALNPTLAEEEEPHVHGAPKDGKVNFKWGEMYQTCVAVYVCSGCGETLTKDCDVEILETKNPTVEEEGFVKYQASVEIAGVTYTDTQVVVLAKLDPLPDTGDTAMIGLYVTVMLVAAAAAVVVLKKKKNA